MYAISALLTILALIEGGAAKVQSEPMDLCRALDSVGRGQEIPVRLHGIYMVGPEHQVFYDPGEPACPMDIDSWTWVEFSPDADTSELGRKQNLLRQSHRIFVTFEGVLVGPPAIAPDRLDEPAMSSLANRTASQGYGHLNASASKLVVAKVSDVSSVPEDTPYPELHASSGAGRFEVIQAALPRFPIALRLGVSGTVLLKITIKGGLPTAVVALAGDRMLAKQAAEDARTWRWRAETDGTVTTRFIYSLERRARGDSPLPRIELELPYVVRFMAESHDR